MTTVFIAAASSNPILPATGEIVWSVLSFLLLLLVLGKWAYPPVKKMMADRAAKIRNDLDAAELARAEAQRTLEEYREQLAQAKREATHILDEARQTAEALRADLLVKAEEDVTILRARNQEALRIERQRVIAELRTEVGSLALELAEKIIDAEVDRAASQTLIDSFISEIGAAQA
ncbi:MAG: F0F1 ATP synthase subunit B [Acidimicrobiaceae bacterium]|nr:F0F1 ATP synthase subunit B [Acidimicrobiaceae bacterium]